MTLNTHQADRITGGGPPSDYASVVEIQTQAAIAKALQPDRVGAASDADIGTTIVSAWQKSTAVATNHGNRQINVSSIPYLVSPSRTAAQNTVGWEATRLGTKLIVYRPGATKPTFGLWAVGDECSFGTPLADGPPGAVFTALGWKFQSSLEV